MYICEFTNLSLHVVLLLSISVQEMLFCSHSVPLLTAQDYNNIIKCIISVFTNPSLHVVLLHSNAAWQHATSIVSSTCVGMTTGASPEDWRQVEDLFDRIRNCGESGGHTDSDAYSMHTFNWMANKICGQVRVCQWKDYACGESGCTSVTLAEHPHL